MVKSLRCFKKSLRGKGGHNPVEREGQVTGSHTSYAQCLHPATGRFKQTVVCSNSETLHCGLTRNLYFLLHTSQNC